MRRNSILDWFYDGGYPLTRALIVVTALLSVMSWLGAPVAGWLAFMAPVSLLAQPWTAITYPLVAFDPIGMLFYGLMLWWIGGSLERSWGIKTFALFFLAMTLISALSLSLGAWLLKTGIIPIYYQLPLAGLTVAWCALNPNLEIRIYGIIPVLAKWVGIGTALIVFFSYGRGNILLGLFALASCAASYYWIRVRGWRDSFTHAYQAPQPKTKPKKPPHDDDFSIRDLNPIEKWKRAQRKKKFQRLFEDDKK